jgi:hypothetical protein
VSESGYESSDGRRAAWIALATVVAFIVIVPFSVALGRSGVAFPPPADDKAALLFTYERNLERVSHYEDMLVTIGTVSLAILAAVGGLVFTKDFQDGPIPPSGELPEAGSRDAAGNAHNNRIYVGILTVTLLTTVAYTHVFRYYSMCYAYASELEMRLSADTRLRMASSIWADVSSGAMPPAGIMFGFMGLYSVAVSTAVIFLFGRRFKQPLARQVGIAAGVWVLGALYVVPAVSRYLALADLARTVSTR